LLTTNEPGREPELSEIEERVREDWRRSRIRENTEEAIEDIVSAYDVRVTYEHSPQPRVTNERPPK
jgi:hypothetical protein